MDHDLDSGAFAALMAPLGPFERRPVLAAGVSGGADSLALCLLAHHWARERGGRVVGLVVDHGLRPESADEAAGVARRLSTWGIETALLRWAEPRRGSGIQAAARRARYRLMSDWCRDAAILHLLLAHHRDDQAETFLLRLGHGSGLDGLAAMAPIRETDTLRILRPLLGVAPERLRAMLRARGVPWVEDPANRDPAFERVRIRRLLPELAHQGVGTARLARVAGKMGGARRAIERAVARHLANCAELHPAGYCMLDRARWLDGQDEIGKRALERALVCIGGGAYPPRRARLMRLWRELAGASGDEMAGRTLAGCRILANSGRILICREAGLITDEEPIEGGDPVTWDGRFRLRVVNRRRHAGWVVRRLGEDGWAAALAADPRLRDRPVPAAVRPGLPAICGLDGLIAVPHLKFVRADVVAVRLSDIRAEFRPVQSLAAAAFALTRSGG